MKNLMISLSFAMIISMSCMYGAEVVGGPQKAKSTIEISKEKGVALKPIEEIHKNMAEKIKEISNTDYFGTKNSRYEGIAVDKKSQLANTILSFVDNLEELKIYFLRNNNNELLTKMREYIETIRTLLDENKKNSKYKALFTALEAGENYKTFTSLEEWIKNPVKSAEAEKPEAEPKKQEQEKAQIAPQAQQNLSHNLSTLSVELLMLEKITAPLAAAAQSKREEEEETEDEDKPESEENPPVELD